METYNFIFENGRWHSYYCMTDLSHIKQLEEWHNTKLKKILKITNAYTPKAIIKEFKADNLTDEELINLMEKIKIES